jgi:drug/metabolite transporter (DMT)-like permease
LAGLAGVVIVLRPGTMTLGMAHLSAFCGASLGALYYIILRKTGGVERTAVIMIYPTIAQTAATALMLPFVYQPMPVAHLGLSGLMALEGFLGSVFIIAAYRHAPAIVVAPMQYSQIIWATLFGTLYFGEPMDAATIIGIGVIIASGLFITLRSKPQPSILPLQKADLNTSI